VRKKYIICFLIFLFNVVATAHIVNKPDLKSMSKNKKKKMKKKEKIKQKMLELTQQQIQVIVLI
jgi:penicillin-binding protein-related factor A (putative recombinase)